MKKYFNIAGPCWPNKHYMLPAQERCHGLLDLIKQEEYFVIHAARQTGKTTLLMDLVHELNESGAYYALYCSLESVYGIRQAEKGIPAIMSELIAELELHEELDDSAFTTARAGADYNTMLRLALTRFCKTLNKPLVILFDEVDCLSDETLISFLRQLRYGYVNRGRTAFVHSLALVGMRNIRDYKAKIRDDRETLGTTSPFNIISDALTLRNFNPEEVTRLYVQHTEQSGQSFSAEVVQTVYHYTQGQPWLVNALAKHIVERMLASDYSQSITVAHVHQAVETLIKRRDTHIDSLMERLKEPRVQRFIEPMLIGQALQRDPLDNDYQYVLDLGLLRIAGKQIVPANPIYGEIIGRYLSLGAQYEMEQTAYPPTAPAYLVDGRLDMRRLLGDFQQFWRENSDIWIKRYQYQEAAPHLVLQAFLQRMINAGGSITREMVAGSGRLDLGVHYGEHVYPLELKIRYKTKTAEDGRQQITDYMDTLGCSEGWLIVFDRRSSVKWDEKIFWQTDESEGKTVHTVGC